MNGKAFTIISKNDSEKEDPKIKAINLVLEKWRKRIKEIKNQLDYVGRGLDGNSPAVRELYALEDAIDLMKGALQVDNDSSLRVFKIFLNND